MNRREFLRVPAAVPLLGQSRSTGARPNVIILLTDDQGYGDLSAHGNPRLKTPMLDRLHRESVRLTDFHVAPMCTPTRSQLMTGRDALYNRAMNVSSGRALLRRDLPAMAEIFRDSGYETGVFGKWHLGDNYPYRPMDRGFKEAVWFPSSHIGATSDAWNNDYYNDEYRHNSGRKRYQGYCTDVFCGEAMAWMRKQGRESKPFFAYLPLNAAHIPLFVEERYRQQYAGLPKELAAFFGMISNIDENVGRLEAMLKETGLRNNTLLLFITDNGGTFGVNLFNAGMRGQKVTLWEGGHRVPSFWRWPEGRLEGGRDVGELTHVQDVLPTLIDFCGLKAPAGTKFDGISLAPLLRNSKAKLPDRMLVVQFSRMNAARPQFGDAAVMWKSWRLITGDQLYDVASDPGQTVNVIEKHPEIAAMMRAHYEEWWKRVEPGLDSYLPVHIGADAENPVLISPTEWADVFLDQTIQIRRGERKNGEWHVVVEKSGEYEFRLRRWPDEVKTPMRAGVPAHQGEIGGYAAGVALPISKARLRIGGMDRSLSVGPEDEESVFRLRLTEGYTRMQTWLMDDSGNEICGAYYVYVERKQEPGK